MDMEDGPFVQEHQYQESTMIKYIQPVMKTDYAVGDWVWSDTTSLPIMPLTQDQKEYLMILINQKNGASADEVNFAIKAAEDAGYITEDEAKELMYENASKNYEEIMSRFKNKYHFRPRLVAKWQEGIAFEDEFIIPYQK